MRHHLLLFAQAIGDYNSMLFMNYGPISSSLGIIVVSHPSAENLYGASAFVLINRKNFYTLLFEVLWPGITSANYEKDSKKKASANCAGPKPGILLII